MATIDTCAIPTKTQFCNEDGYDILLVRMIKVVNAPISEQTETPATQPKLHLYARIILFARLIWIKWCISVYIPFIRSKIFQSKYFLIEIFFDRNIF